MSKIFIATPCFGDLMYRGFVNSLSESKVLLAKHGHTIHFAAFGNESLITRARNNLAAQFMKSQCDILLFIDADITWRPEAILELVNSPYELCGIPYPTKAYDWNKITDIINNPKVNNKKMSVEELNNFARIYTVNFSKENPRKDLLNGWKKVNALGTGFLLIRKQALEVMYEHYRESLNYINDVKYYLEHCDPKYCVAIFDTLIDPLSRRYLSEDYAFCKRWTDIGGEIYGCLNHRLQHTGTATF